MTKDEYLSYSRGSYTKEERAAAHHRYYLQFATPYMYTLLKSCFDIWGHTQDEHMNDIPLKWWDNLPDVINKNPRSLSDKICTYKVVAREILNQRKNMNKLEVFSAPWCANCEPFKQRLTQNGIPFDSLNLEDPDPFKAKANVCKAIQFSIRSLPAVVIYSPEGEVLLLDAGTGSFDKVKKLMENSNG